MIIALAVNLPLPSDCLNFDHNQWPGSGWVKYLVRRANKLGIGVSLAQDLPADVKDVYLVQEDLCKHGDHLKHAVKAVNFGLESVIYAKEWHERKSTLGFKETMDLGDNRTYFPSFEDKDVVAEIAPREKNLCMIISNKHYSMLGIDPPVSQLHDYRYSVIRHGVKHWGLDLYGRGWGPTIPEPKDKLDILRQYKATIIIENDARAGYFTEKYVHAMISGCIPIYYGDPLQRPILEATPSAIEYAVMCAKEQEYFDDIWLDARNQWMREESHKYHYDHFAKACLDLVVGNK